MKLITFFVAALLAATSFSQTVPRVSVVGVTYATSGAPSNSIGQSGDFAFDAATKTMYQKGAVEAAVVSNAGTTACNGTYIPAGTLHGKTLYQKTTGTQIRWNSDRWEFYVPTDSIRYADEAYEAVEYPWLVTAYSVNGAGSLPVPTVTHAPAIVWDSGTILSGTSDGQQIFDGSHVLAADFGARKLTWSNGTSIALDFSTQDRVSSEGGNWILFQDGHATFSGEVTAAAGFNGSGANLTDIPIPTIPKLISDSHQFGWDGSSWLPGLDEPIRSASGSNYFDNSGFHGEGFYGGVGVVIAGTKTATGTATTTFTVSIGVEMPDANYKVATEGDNALSAAVHYVNNKTTTAFDIVYLAGLTGSVSVDWIVTP